MRRIILIAFILLSSLIVSPNIISASQQPAIISEISEANIQWILNNLTSFQTRRAGTVECNMSAEYIYNYLKAINISVDYEFFNTPSGVLANVVADITGSSLKENYVIIGAHYDSISSSGNAPGAVDNAAAVAVLMELARVLSNHSLSRSVKILFFSGEEIGRYGSLNWVSKNYEIRWNLTATLILDMVAYGNSLVIDYNSVSKPLADYIFEKTSFKNYLSVEENNYLSDHQSFWSANIPAVLIHQNNPLEYPYYHTSEDTVDKVNFKLLALTASLTLEAVYFLATDPSLENLYYKANPIYLIILIVLPIVFLTCLGLVVSYSSTKVGSFQRSSEALRLQLHVLVRGAHSSAIPCLSLRHRLCLCMRSDLGYRLAYIKGTSLKLFKHAWIFKFLPIHPLTEVRGSLGTLFYKI